MLTNGQRVRYIGINTPEIDYENQKAQPFGYEARSFNKKLVLSQKIRLEFDRERHDRFGRLLAYVFLPDGSFLNERLLENGLAFYLYRRPNLKYDNRLLKAQQDAMKAQKGAVAQLERRKRQVYRKSKIQAVSPGPRVHMPKASNGKTGSHFPQNGMPSTPVTLRQKNASKNFGAMSERIKNA